MQATLSIMTSTDSFLMKERNCMQILLTALTSRRLMWRRDFWANHLPWVVCMPRYALPPKGYIWSYGDSRRNWVKGSSVHTLEGSFHQLSNSNTQRWIDAIVMVLRVSWESPCYPLPATHIMREICLCLIGFQLPDTTNLWATQAFSYGQH